MSFALAATTHHGSACRRGARGGRQPSQDEGCAHLVYPSQWGTTKILVGILAFDDAAQVAQQITATSRKRDQPHENSFLFAAGYELFLIMIFPCVWLFRSPFLKAIAFRKGRSARNSQKRMRFSQFRCVGHGFANGNARVCGRISENRLRGASERQSKTDSARETVRADLMTVCSGSPARQTSTLAESAFS